jgi:hypothetical protein
MKLAPDYIFCNTKEDCGTIVHVVTWTMDKTIGKSNMCQKVYQNGFYGPDSAIKDAADRLNVAVSKTVYGLNGYANARVEG